MAAGPQRRAEPAKHLNAAIVPVEKALLQRAAELEARPQYLDEIPWKQVAAEFRALADELHHW